jgi:hypothetical protein
MTPKLFFPVLLAASISACGPAPDAAAPAAAAPAPRAADTAAAAAPVGVSDWTLLDAVPQDAAFVVRLDAKGLRAAPIWAASLEAFKAKGLLDVVEALSRDCGFPVLESVDELVISGSFESGLVPLLVARVSRDPEAALRCVAKVDGGRAPKQTTFAGRPALVTSDVVVVAPADGVLLIGREVIAREAVPWIADKRRGRSPLVASLRTKPPVVLSAVVRPPQIVFRTMNASLEADASHLRLQVLVEAGSPDQANELATIAKTTLRDIDKDIDAAGLPPAASKQLRGLLASATIRAEGNQVHGDVGVKGGVAEQAAFMGSLAALLQKSVEQYLAASKTSEAKSTVSAIARSLVAYGERETPTGGRVTRFPPSTPRTPAKVPKGVAEPPGAGWDHPTWKAIGFRVDQPSRYSYEVATSADGKTATVRAFGDLDADGKLSTFSMVVKMMGRDTAAQIGRLESKDELE